MMLQNNEDHKEMKDMIKSFGNKLDTALEKMDNKFASKWTEKAWVWLFISAGTVFVGLLVRWLVTLELK